MITAASPDIESFQTLVAERFGLQFDDFKLSSVIDVLQRRSEALHVSSERYLASLATSDRSTEWRELARELTIGETYFFRNNEQFNALREVALPARMHARSTSRRLRIASIGCASGEEPYSIAMVLRESIAELSAWNVEIVGVDVNPAIIEKAKAGRYSSWSLRGTPDEVRERWFRPAGRELVLDDSIRRMVKFEERNAVVEDARFWAPASFDIVFCRNMLMYLTPDASQGVIERIAGALTPGGFLFLGHAETLRGLSRQFHLLHTNETFYYRKRSDDDDQARDAPESWAETIAHSAERVRSLTEDAGRRTDAALLHNARSWDLTVALELLRKERYEDALALIDTLPNDASRDTDVLVLRAVLLAHSGDLVAAEEVCRELLTIDELNAGAHYLMALCREGAHDRAGAIDHDQTAVYLDPSFSAPRLHLGLLAQKSGDRAAARRDLAQALTLLAREDASRLLLFGGGFSREALIALCRAELAACGGTL
jgi:chemotaxis protein methyltransferase CheR